MDERLLGALNNLSDALSEIAYLMSQKSSEKGSDVSKALVSGDITEQINGINEGIKSIKSDTTKILENQNTLMSMSKEKGDKDDIAAKVGGDKNKQSMIKDGLSTILLIGVAVVALGAAFNLIGDVPIGSVIALSIAIPILAFSFMKVNEKMKESKFDPKKDGINLLTVIVSMAVAIVAVGAAFNLIGGVPIGSVIALSIAIPILAFSFIKVSESMKKSKFDPKKDGLNLLLTIVGLSVAVVASSYILGMVQPIGLAQLGTTILIAGMFAAIGFTLGNILKGFKDVSIGDALKASILMPLLFPAIALAIVGSSYLLNQVQPVGLVQLLTSLAISLLFVPLAFAAGMLIKMTKGLSIEDMVTIPITMVLMSGAVMLSSRILAEATEIDSGKLWNLLLTGITLAVMSVALGGAMYLLSKMGGVDSYLEGALAVVIVATAIMISSRILAEATEIDSGKLWNMLLMGVTLAVMSVALGGAMYLLSKMGGVDNYLEGALVVVIVATAIMISSHILSLGNYDNYPSYEWAEGVGSSMLAFGLPTLAFGLAILATGGVGLLAIAGGAVAVLIVAATVMATSHILALGNYSSYPPLDWAEGVGLSMLGFGLPILGLGTFILATAGLGLLAMVAGAAGALVVAGTIAAVSHIISTGNYGSGPSLEWATSTALLLGAFAPAVVLLGALSAIPFVGGAILEAGSEAVLGIAQTIVDTASIFAGGSFTGGPTKEWAEGIGIAIGAFAPVYSMLAESMGVFSSGPTPEEFTKAIRVVSQGIVDAADFFGENAASFDPKKAPSKEWAEGVGIAIGAFAPVYDVIMNGGWGDGVDDLTDGILSMADSIIEVGDKFNKSADSFGFYPPSEWGEGVKDSIQSFSPLFDIFKSGDFDDDVLEDLSDGIEYIVDSIVYVGKKFSKNPGIWSSYPSSEWVNGVRTSIEGFASILGDSSKINLEAFEGGLISDSPIDKIADGMHNMADAYDRLGDSITKFNTSLDGMNLEKVNAFRMLTNNIAVLSAMDSYMFSDMMEVLEENSSVFTDLLKQQTEQDNAKANVGESVTKTKKPSPIEEQNKILIERMESMISLLSNISNSNSSIDDHLTSQIDNKNKELI